MVQSYTAHTYTSTTNNNISELQGNNQETTNSDNQINYNISSEQEFNPSIPSDTMIRSENICVLPDTNFNPTPTKRPQAESSDNEKSSGSENQKNQLISSETISYNYTKGNMHHIDEIKQGNTMKLERGIKCNYDLNALEHKEDIHTSKILFTIDSIIGKQTDTHEKSCDNKERCHLDVHNNELTKYPVQCDDEKQNTNNSSYTKKDVYETIPSPPPMISDIHQKITHNRELSHFMEYPTGYGHYTGIFTPNPPATQYNQAAMIRNNYYSQLLTGMVPHVSVMSSDVSFNPVSGLSRAANTLQMMSPYFVQAAAVAATGSMQQSVPKAMCSSMNIGDIYGSKTSPPASSPVYNTGNIK